MKNQATPSCRLRSGFIFAFLLALAGPSTRAAIPVSGTNVQIGGFFSQGYLQSSGNNHPFEAKDGTWDFREMGVNVSTTVGAHLRFGAQGFAQRLGNYGGDKVKLDWAVADYNFRQEIGIRIGRIKYPKGLYGEALDLDALRPFVFLPMGVYNPVLRDFSSSFDGGMIYGALSAGRAGSFDYKAFYGDIPMNTDMGVADYFNNASLFAAPGVSALSVDRVAGVAVDWTTPVSGLKVHVSYSKLYEVEGRGQFAAMPVLPVLIRVSPSYTTLGVEYATEAWTFAAEWLGQEGDSYVQAAPVLNSTGKFGSDNSYVSAARRFGDKWEVGANFSFSRNRHPTAGTPEAAKKLKDWAICVRYNVNEHVVIKAEHHWLDGRYNMFNTAKTPNPSLKDDSSFFAVKTTLSF